jgi:uncharacterized membrane protein YqjE
MERMSGSWSSVRQKRGGLSPAERTGRDETRLAYAQTVLHISRMMFAAAVTVLLLLIYTFIHADRNSASFYVSVVTYVLDVAFIAYNIFTTIRYTRLRNRLSGEDTPLQVIEAGKKS